MRGAPPIPCRFPGGGRGGRRGIAALAAAALLACGGKEAPPTADEAPPPPPNLSGKAVMLFPAQGGTGAAALDGEVAFWLKERGARVRWIGPAALERVVLRTPGLGIRLDALDVTAFGRGRVRRVGDPLFGDLRRLAAVTDAAYALVPVAAGHVPAPDGPGRVEVAAALIDAHDGRVVWFGVVAGSPGAADDPAAAASAAQALARALFP